MTAVLLCLALTIPCSHREGPHHPVIPEPRGGQAVAETNVQIGERLAAARGWVGDQWLCLFNLWNRESGWQVSDPNPTSQADGIPQANPASKMASAGPDWQTNPETQIRWGISYVAARYGDPCAAWANSQRFGWY